MTYKCISEFLRHDTIDITNSVIYLGLESGRGEREKSHADI